ncbi:hypothetical protein VNI00_007880 [Paramarasmius palmivorus]|uniref:Transmembrane protein n=1 Tax=Paramarasmius palmivorus TaxID=297713 RepID=A0AAW0CXR3_9AGAR
MPSLRTISYYLVAALAAATFTNAAPTPLGDITPALQARCGECEAKENPLPVLVKGVQDKISPIADKLNHLPAGGCTPDAVTPIVKEMKDILVDASAQVQVYIDANVDLDILLAGSANGGAAISVNAFASILVGLVNVIVSACLSVLKLTVSVDLQVMVKILADLCITLSLFIQLCLKLVVGLSAAIALQLGAFIALCVQLGIKASVGLLLGISL